MDEMQWLTFGMISGLAILLIIGLPIAYAMLGVGVISVIASQGWSSADYLIGNFPYTTSAEFALIIIPMFLLMGEMAHIAGLSERAFRAARVWLGHLPGGLPIASVGACAAFSAVCGSSIVTAVTIGRIAIPEMLKAGVSQRLAGGAVATAGALGVLIPPSGILVVYSIATQVPVLDLFAAAIVPGIITAIVYGIGIYIWVRLDPREQTAIVQEKYKVKERLQALAGSWEILLLFGIVMGAMFSGVATPTEAAAFGAVVATALAVYRRTPFHRMRQAVLSSGRSTASIFILIVGAGVFSLAFAVTQVPQKLALLMAALDVHPVVLLIILMVPFLVLGMFLDAISMILLTMPLLFPIVVENNINPVLFGILVTKMVEIGNVTPPVGLNIFVLKNVAPDLKISEIFRGIVPFIGMELFLVGIFIAFPELVLFPVQ